MSIAIDEENLIPFFSPIQREDDTIFGFIRNNFFENDNSMQIPGTLLHDKQKGHEYGINKFGQKTTDIITGLLAHIIEKNKNLLIHNNQTKNLSLDEKIVRRMNSIGENMVKFSENRTTFQENLEKRTKSLRNGYYLGYILILTELAYKKQIHSDEWLKDMIENIMHQKKLSDTKLDEMKFFLWDIPGSNAEEKKEIFREWFRLFGLLMIRWPKIFQTAKMLNEKGLNPLFDSPVN